MSRSLNGWTVMLTGAGGALATAIAQELVDAGAELVLVGRGESLRRAEDRFPAKEVLDVDLTDPASINILRTVKVDALVHTVGTFAAQDAQKATSEDLRAQFSVNFDTLFHAVQGVLPHMLRQKDGVILGVSAGQAARLSGPKAALYTASKAAVGGYLGSLNDELKGKGVYARTLYPMGSIDTAKNRADGVNPDQMIDTRELAQAAIFLLSREPRAHLNDLKVFPDA